MSRLSGTVTLSGSAVSGATVYVVDTNTNSIVATETTDSNGDWEATGLAQSASERYHALVQYDDGSTKYNAESLPFLSTPGIIQPGVSDIAVASPTPGITTSAVPDAGDLHARYDATELSLSDGNSVSTWPDETGNGIDLTAGTAPTYQTSVINGNPVVRFDGTDDFLDTTFSALSQPNHIFAVIQMRETVSSTAMVHDSNDDGSNRHLFYLLSDNSWSINAGTGLNSNTQNTTDSRVFAELYNGASSALRRDGTEIASGDAGAQSLDGFTVGSSYSNGNFAAVDVGEILIYPQDKSGIQSDVESYLSDKWGITI